LPELPPCPNFLEKRCEQSAVYIARETDDAFIFVCRTCGCRNVWPKDRAEQAGKYEAFLKHKAAREAQERHSQLRPGYSLPGDR
jgi:hypothetical protein